MRLRNSYKDMTYFERQADAYSEIRDLNAEDLAASNLSEQARQFTLNESFELQVKDSLWLYNTGSPIREVVHELNKAWPLYIQLLEESLNNNFSRFEKMQIVPGDKLKYFPLLVLSGAPKELTHRIFEFTNTTLNLR